MLLDAFSAFSAKNISVAVAFIYSLFLIQPSMFSFSAKTMHLHIKIFDHHIIELIGVLLIQKLKQ